MTQAQAYGQGKSSVWQEMGPVCPFLEAGLIRNWKQGRRDAQAENRLDQDTEWDNLEE